MEIYQKPAAKLVMLQEVEELCVNGSHDNYKPANWTDPNNTGIVSGHEDYTSDTWGNTGDDITGGHKDYSSGVWGE